METMFIPIGRNYAIKRKDLCEKYQITDDVMREKLRKYREQGEVIINLQDGLGYFRPQKDETYLVELHIKQETNRAISCFKAIRAEKKWLAEQNQTSFDDSIFKSIFAYLGEGEKCG